MGSISLNIGRLSSFSFRKLSFFFFKYVNILLYLISFGCVLNNKKLLNLIRWLIKNKVNFNLVKIVIFKI